MPDYNTRVPQALALFLQKLGEIDDFFETGTHKGETAFWAKDFFKRVYTVEEDKALYTSSAWALSKFNNVNSILGDSADAIHEFLQSDRKAMFWLDAHWCGGETAGQGYECPVLREIEAINRSQLDHIILVDDARLFLRPPGEEHDASQWPDACAIFRVLGHLGRRYVVVFSDVIIAVPEHLRPALVEELRQWP
jgi:hypothetical protein